MIPREIQAELEKSLREYPVVCITGPRQSGKTTLARMALPDFDYVNFEDPITRDIFNEDPRGFLHQHRNGAVFDEVQHVPALLSFLQVHVDKDPIPGRFLLTGSQHFGMTERISQSLAGRTAMLELLPFSAGEMASARMLADELDPAIWQGAYPPVHDRNLRPDRWYANYMATYVQRDVRQISQIQNLDIFTRLMRLCAGNVGQLVNTVRLATECGVDHKTVRNWLGVMEASYVLTRLSPYYRSFRKRIIKTPKMYFFDTGLACHLMGIQSPHQLATHPLRGALFENWVFAELSKSIKNNALAAHIYFWRTHGGQEVDFIIENGQRIDGIEVKSGMTVQPSMMRSLNNTASQWKGGTIRTWVVYGGEDFINIGKSVVVPWRRTCYPLPEP
ncbi:MAG: ATP-binding protein [Desulfobacterales bacterium]|nr:ATP-binding protein [Desulfobacterales bacterium]